MLNTIRIHVRCYCCDIAITRVIAMCNAQSRLQFVKWQLYAQHLYKLQQSAIIEYWFVKIRLWGAMYICTTHAHTNSMRSTLHQSHTQRDQRTATHNSSCTQTDIETMTATHARGPHLPLLHKWSDSISCKWHAVEVCQTIPSLNLFNH